MFMSFANPVFLYGLPALAIPVLIHFLNRRKFEIVDWGAMQFLRISDEVRRRNRLDQLLLLLLRMLILALLLILLAGPSFKSRWLSRFAKQPRRDLVLIVDGSGSMALQQNKQSLLDLARGKARKILEDFGSDDRFQVLVARDDVTNLSLQWNNSWNIVEGHLKKEIPHGSLNIVAAYQQASDLLKGSVAEKREILFLTDGQKHSWQEPNLVARLKTIQEAAGENAPLLRIEDVAALDAAKIANLGITRLNTRRTIALPKQEIAFEGEIQATNKEAANSHVRILVDHRPIGEVQVENLSPGKAKFHYTHRFADTGSHLIEFRLPADEYPSDDNYELAIRVIPQIHVQVIDPKFQLNAEGNPSLIGSQFLLDALAPIKDPSPLFAVERLKSDTRTSRSDSLGSTSAKVEILFDLPSPPQADLVHFVQNGNGLLIAPGDDFDPRRWRESEQGHALLPAHPIKILGSETDLTTAPRIDPKSLVHPVMQLFAKNSELLSAYFPKYWDLSTEGIESAQVLARLTNGKPFLVEKNLGLGKVLLCAVPLDNRWRTNLTDLGDYVRLMHELVLHLGSESGFDNNQPAASGLTLPERIAADSHMAITIPGGEPIRDRMREIRGKLRSLTLPGIYSFREDNQPSQYVVLQENRAEHLLTYMNEADWEQLKSALPNKLLRNEETAAGDTSAQNLFSLRPIFLLLLILFLFGEAWFARRHSIA
ncbi:BatA domain-containing protein [Telmatocola sphagniphila]|uniref:BatA domain-containing protein n=1 Tax=Telmatocola sphagniphila TaxID=1123043 RepID=A0A8E6F0F0_9BACT|nr:BatA domain-containing protein [Telmatocola sphagniphila]QVL34733.1 BatA domain-containing protein [Telmatocola sphagniphila]